VIGVEQHATGGDHGARALEQRHQVTLVTRLVRGLQRDDRVEGAELVRPGGLAKSRVTNVTRLANSSRCSTAISCIAGEKSSAT